MEKIFLDYFCGMNVERLHLCITGLDISSDPLGQRYFFTITHRSLYTILGGDLM